MKKPIDKKLHGIIDYVFSSVLMAVPTALKVNSTAVKTYQGLGSGMLALNTLTNTPVAIKKSISFKDHQKADLGLLLGMASLTFSKFIMQDKKALAFHAAILGTAIANYVLTDYDTDDPFTTGEIALPQAAF